MPRRELLTGLLLLAAAPLLAGSREVRIQLRVAPKLELAGSERILIGPIVLEPTDEATRRVDLASVGELESYIRRLLRRNTRLQILPQQESVMPPSPDPNQFKGEVLFWRQLAAAAGADFVVSAAVDVEVLDRTGYTTEKYVSPEDGKTYFRQVLVEETGFKVDILLMVFDQDGVLVHEEQIADFQPRQERKLEEFKGMFDDLYTLENRLVGVFVPRFVEARRYLYTG